MVSKYSGSDSTISSSQMPLVSRAAGCTTSSGAGYISCARYMRWVGNMMLVSGTGSCPRVLAMVYALMVGAEVTWAVVVK